MSRYEEVIQYLDLAGFHCVSDEISHIKIFRHKDGTIVKVEREVSTR